MLTPGHVAATYLLLEGTKAAGIMVSPDETIFLLITTNLPDLDFLAGYITGKTGEMHHQNVTHTPLGALLLAVLLKLVFNLSTTRLLLAAGLLLFHLLLDDLDYLVSNRIKGTPQINWLYPLTKFSHQTNLEKGTLATLKKYLKTPCALLELILIITAVTLWAVRI
jgi:cytochrome b